MTHQMFQSKRQKVVIVGGGVAGLTAAHELVERDFDVEVYERRDFLGGKAASTRIPSKRTNGRSPGNGHLDHDRPGEHGFRFFPAWYRHLPDTLRRIPVRPRLGSETTVFHHLVPVESNLLVQYGREPIPIVLHAPRSIHQVQSLAVFTREIAAMGLPFSDVAAFLVQLARFLRTPEEVRKRVYDAQSWWTFLDVKARSEAFQTLTVATTRRLLAAKAEEASAYTIALMAIRTLFESLTKSDHVLDGPTSEVWIEPWQLYLEGRGVRFNTDFELDTLHFDGSGPSISSLTFVSTPRDLYFRHLRETLRAPDVHAARTALRRSQQYLVVHDRDGGRVVHRDRATFEEIRRVAQRRLDSWEQGGLDPDDPYFTPVKEIVAGNGVDDARAKLGASLDYVLGKRDRKPAALALDDASLSEIRRQADFDLAAAPPRERISVSADYFLFALPVEQMAYYVGRSKTLQSYAPSLSTIVKLSGAVDWMAGIQFYLRYPARLPRGHIVCADSEWALTAIEQTQFWHDVPIPEDVNSILSVDISAWDKKGRFVRKEAFLCTKDEIAKEVWAQLKASFNKPGAPDVLRDGLLVNGTVEDAYHLDDNIVERYDRKKQAAFAQGLDRALFREEVAALESEDLSALAASNPNAPFVFGDRLELNAEPLLVNRPGSLALRPEARTDITNMFLAGDYVATSTNLSCMEGANESARLAVNAILEEAGSKYEPCRTWRFEEVELLPTIAALASLAERIPGTAAAVQASAQTVTTLGDFARSTSNKLKLLWKKNDDA